jgi:membrane peptidoglycan carboxypeptidase
VSARDLPAGFVDILLAVEDPAFRAHSGVDLSTPGAGLTTITQALCKGLFFERFRPGLAKLPQTLFALALDARVSKEDQLDLFVNTVYMGRHEGRSIEGLPAAALAYHGKSLDALSRDEFIVLVAMIMGPDRLNVASRPEVNAHRADRIRKLLAGQCRPSGPRDVELAGCG